MATARDGGRRLTGVEKVLLVVTAVGMLAVVALLAGSWFIGAVWPHPWFLVALLLLAALWAFDAVRR